VSTTIAIDFGTTRTKLAYVGTKGETELMRFQREDLATASMNLADVPRTSSLAKPQSASYTPAPAALHRAARRPPAYDGIP
jgi:molecular chaperone DnaK (HSP70)